MNIKELAKKYEQYTIDMRREFHMNPELSMQDVRTAKRIKEELKKIGVAYESNEDMLVNGVAMHAQYAFDYLMND